MLNRNLFPVDCIFLRHMSQTFVSNSVLLVAPQIVMTISCEAACDDKVSWKRPVFRAIANLEIFLFSDWGLMVHKTVKAPHDHLPWKV